MPSSICFRNRTNTGIISLCAAIVAVLGTFGANARSESILQAVLNNEGPIYNTYDWKLAPGSGSVASGTFQIIGTPVQTTYNPPFFSVPDGYSNTTVGTSPTYAYPTTVSTTLGGVQNITDMNYPGEAADMPAPSTMVINLDAGQPTDDYIEIELDLGYVNNLPPDLKPIFVSTQFLGFGETGAGTGVYYFAFTQGAGTSAAKNGQMIGGLIDANGAGDVKAFGVVPTPNSAFSGFVLMVLVGVAEGFRKFRNRSCASKIEA